MKKEYYFVEVDLTNMTIVDWGITTEATLTGNTSKPNCQPPLLANTLSRLSEAA